MKTLLGIASLVAIALPLPVAAQEIEGWIQIGRNAEGDRWFISQDITRSGSIVDFSVLTYYQTPQNGAQALYYQLRGDCQNSTTQARSSALIGADASVLAQEEYPANEPFERVEQGSTGDVLLRMACLP